MITLVCATILGFMGAAPASGALYLCEGGAIVRLDSVDNGNAVVLRFGDDLFLLPRIESASGAKYSDGKRIFWSKGSEAFAQEDGTIAAKGCTEIRSAVSADLVRDVFAMPVASTVPMDVIAFNDRLTKARCSGEGWEESVVQIALEYMGHLEGGVVAIVKRDQPTESPTRSTVIVIRDGLLDDSVRAIRDEIHLFRTDDGGWELTSANRAYLCRRGSQQQSYRAAPCP